VEIIGGWEAKPHSRPYMAYLEIQSGNDTYRCGGFLVSENFVLTAAHCNGDEITVSLGAHNIKQQERSRQKITARRQIPHPQYNNEPLNNDIMLLQLEKSAKLNEWVGTIGLPRSNERVKAGTECSVAGWGSTRTEYLLFPDTLQEVDVVVMPDAKFGSNKIRVQYLVGPCQQYNTKRVQAAPGNLGELHSTPGAALRGNTSPLGSTESECRKKLLIK
uniref:Peptidase S1 domain-containing protein n=1 Tax=Chelydra serpentina TaxID=8475 RepID=A0A8C3SCQ2_CHESE